MKRATRDRGEVMRVMGLCELSPALRGEGPELRGLDDPSDRCGWQPFFSAVERHGLALVWEANDEPAPSLVPKDEARSFEKHSSLREQWLSALRFFRALRRDCPPS